MEESTVIDLNFFEKSDHVSSTVFLKMCILVTACWVELVKF